MLLVRIGVLSDTHKDLSLARVALEKMGKIDLLFHAGDHYKDAIILSEVFQVKTKVVAGNCDYSTNKPKEELLDIDGYIILLTHGHQYGVKFGLERLYYRSQEIGANIVIYGHTHIPLYLVENNVHFLNPGSPTLPRGNSNPSYAVIDLKPKLKIRIVEIVK